MASNDLETLQVVVDGIIFELQPRGGISRMFYEILPRMCAIEDQLRIRLLSDQYTLQALPEHAQIERVPIQTYRKYLRPEFVWRALLTRIRDARRQTSIGDGSNQIWHSTYYTSPSNWAGLQVLTVHDLIYDRSHRSAGRPGFVVLGGKHIENNRRGLYPSRIVTADLDLNYPVFNQHDIQRLSAGAPAFEGADCAFRINGRFGDRPGLWIGRDDRRHRLSAWMAVGTVGRRWRDSGVFFHPPPSPRQALMILPEAGG